MVPRPAAEIHRAAAARAFLIANALKPRLEESFDDLQERSSAEFTHFASGEFALSHLGRHDPVRATRYNTLSWTPVRVALADVLVLPGMCGLPTSWTLGSASYVAKVLSNVALPPRAARVARLLRLADEVGAERAIAWMTILPLLCIPSRHAGHSDAAPWLFDDGCVRSVVLASLGVTHALMYAGT